MELSRARQKAEQEVRIKRTETRKYTMESFFELLA
jgi:hypothetical protein